MNEMNAMNLLAAANPVHTDELEPLSSPGRFDARRPRLALVIAVAVAALTAALVGVFAFAGSSGAHRDGIRNRVELGQMRNGGPPCLRCAIGDQGPTGSNGGLGPIVTGPPEPPPDPTTAFYTDGPTGANGPTRTNTGSGTAGPSSLAEARDALGAPLVLPNVPPVDESDIDKVVKDCGESPRSSACDVGIGFLAQRIWIYYQPADQWRWSSDPLAAYRNTVKNDSEARIIDLGGTPALLGPGGGPNGGNLEFVLDGVRVRIWTVDPAPSGGPTLQAIAQSIVDGSK